VNASHHRHVDEHRNLAKYRNGLSQGAFPTQDSKKEHVMRILATGLAAGLLTAASLAMAVPASAQGVYLDTPAGSVGVGERGYDRDRYDDRYDRTDGRAYYRRDRGRDCRTIVRERERDDGTIVQRRERVCD
jgi:hypothetical protein